MRKLTFYWIITCSIILSMSGRQIGFAQEVKEKPNVLFIICDDLNDWVLGATGAPKVIAPNLNRLRQQSISFTNAHAVVPVCGPSRVCLMTGLYPQITNFYGRAPWEWRDNPSLSRLVPIPLHFLNNGYEVYGTGKLFHEGAGGDFYTDYGIPSDYGPWPWKGKGPIDGTAHPAFYKKWLPYLPEAIHRDLDYGPLSNIPHWKPDLAKDIPGADGWYYPSGKPFRYVNDNDRDKMPDEISADWAVNILRSKHDKPFFLGVGFVRPHAPLYVPQKYYDMFPLKDIQLPPHLQGDLDDCAPALTHRWRLGFEKFHALTTAGGEKAWKEWVQAYLACIAFMDDQLGKLLDALDKSDYGKNTIIVFTSDHGYHVGEKDMIQKWELWNPSTHIPLLIHVPGEMAKQRDNPVSLLDIFPTLIDLCRLPEQPDLSSGMRLNGLSLRPLLENKAHKFKRQVVLMVIKDEAFNSNVPANFSVCSRQYRYTLCGDGDEELYDHYADPNEWTNLAGNKKYASVSKRLRKELMHILYTTKVPEGFGVKQSNAK